MCFGTPQTTAPWLINEEGSLKVLEAAHHHGINTWFTSNAYSNGASEKMIDKHSREKLVLMTKCGLHIGEEMDVNEATFPDEMNQSKDYTCNPVLIPERLIGLSRSTSFQAANCSLARLGTKYIDLPQAQRYDYLKPPEETMKALHDLVQAGKIRYLGTSSIKRHNSRGCSSWWKRTSEPSFSEEIEMNRYCEGTGVGLIPCRLCLREGWLSSYQHPGLTEADRCIIKRVQGVAEKKDWKMSHVALIWLKTKGAIPNVGCTSLKRLARCVSLKGRF
ncbi:hypothetical protein N7520_000577 [Penicillium odoratum]|uniref:uncharacterized protein n=1 Tax=Penicillium odoratum TaxID=1167516 RepID=UPI00254724D5|nr:uncharacterized protein N7520_000577 [Penicillium odoratum]KAJ5777331.1 hypothetical protein N7520_000577 [Penicillium odoratum]